MKRLFLMLALALAAVVTPSAQAGFKVIKTLPNGDQVVRIKTVGVFCPSTTTVCRMTKEGELLPLNAAASSGVLGQVAAPAATASAAYLHRPDQTKVSQQGGGATAGASNRNENINSSSATVLNQNQNQNTQSQDQGQSGGQHVPPGHINNPSGNH